ncbi:MAG: thiopurine S-methyltransferase [Rhodanobacteraceae bacterium]
MEKQFWIERWQAGQTGFNQATPSADLVAYWSALAVPAGSRILVPLAGKSVDMLWLVQQGYRVLGVEIAEQAVRAFFDDNGLDPQIHESAIGSHFVSGDIELVCADIFDVGAEQADTCAAVYDRAALIALPPAMRQRYAAHLSSILPSDCRALLLTMQYEQERMNGPPFSVPRDEVLQLYGQDWQVQELARREIIKDEPRFAQRGLDSMTALTFKLERSQSGSN